MQLQNVIQKPLVTEKALKSQEVSNSYVFAVDSKAGKGLIRAAVEQLFKVSVIDVHTSLVRGKFRKVGRNMGFSSNYKKATVTLKKGDKIEFVEGV